MLCYAPAVARRHARGVPPPRPMLALLRRLSRHALAHSRRRVVRPSVAASAASLLVAPPLAAQELGWSGSAEASANLLFGAARARLAALAAGAARVDSALELRVDAQLTYADSREEDGPRHTTARATRLTAGADWRPFARVSPFVFGSAEASLQQRIAGRLSGGAGAKLTLHRTGDDDVSVSLAVLGERTRALRPDFRVAPMTTRTRWSLRARYRRRLSDALRVTHVTFYQPAVNRPGRYTADSNTSLVVAVNGSLSLTATLRDRYDSEARRRGARSNHDGNVLFGARATF
jgi:hypothetical protein